jgi:alanyl-tRNA synthetase
MSTKKSYLEDSRVTQAMAVVTDFGTAPDGRFWVRLDRTIFHPQGGGQKADRGTIGGFRITHVAHAEGNEADHFMELNAALGRGQKVELQLDEGWRQLNAGFHSGGHLIAALVESRFPGLRAISGHHWPGEARVEFETNQEPVANAITDALAEDLCEIVSKDLLVRVIGEPYSDRSIQIGDYPPVPCGGTHVGHVSHLRGIGVEKVRVKSGKVRISYSVTTEFSGIKKESFDGQT